VTKTEKIFEMLEFVREYPNLTSKDIAHLCDISERAVYRYINTLSRVGFHIRHQNGGYRLQEDPSDVLRKSGIDGLEALKVLIAEGIKHSKDRQAVEYGKRFMTAIEKSLPTGRRRRPFQIEIADRDSDIEQRGGELIIGHCSKPDIINPILTTSSISANLMNLIFSQLVDFDHDQRPIPDLAKKWSVSKDGREWTFLLRDDVKFHDGHPLTAHDVEFTFRSLMDPQNESPKAERYEIVDRIEMDGDYALRIVLKRPHAPFIYVLGQSIVPKHLLEGVDLRETQFNQNPVGSGAFRFAEWTEDDTIVLEANADYFVSERPILDRLVFKAYPDRDTEIQAITKQKMDIGLDLGASDLLALGNNQTFRIYATSGSSYYAVMLNVKDPLFSDMRVRKALDHAIDRDAIVKNQLKGHSRISTGPFSVDSWAYNNDIEAIPYSIEKARELLHEAGWHEDEDGILYNSDQPFEFTLAVPSTSYMLERIAVAIRAQLMKAGIRVILEYSDDQEAQETGRQALLTRIVAGSEPDRAYRFWHSKSRTSNFSFYESNLVDDLLEKSRKTTDMEERKVIYHKIHEIIHDECPAIFLASGCEFIGSNYVFNDAEFSSVEYFLTTMQNWQLVETRRGKGISKGKREANIA